jgi:hypothetical protein
MTMDNQQLFNVVVSLAGFMAIWIINSLTRTIQRLEDKLGDLPHSYVQKDDYRSDIHEVKQILKQIFDKLDAKADKE